MKMICVHKVRMLRKPGPPPKKTDHNELNRQARKDADKGHGFVQLLLPNLKIIDVSTEQILTFNANKGDVIRVFLSKGKCVAVENVVRVGVERGLWTSMKVQAVEGVGPKTEAALNAAGIDSVQALAESSEEEVRDVLSESGIRSSAARIVDNANEAMGG